MDQKSNSAQIRYLLNRWSYRDGSTLIVTGIPTFLLVFDIIYTLQTTGSAILGQNGKKLTKKSNFISSKLLILGSLTTPIDRKPQVSIVKICKNRFWTTGSAILGEKGTKSGPKVKFSSNSISPEQMIEQRLFNSHFNRNTHFPCSV